MHEGQSLWGKTQYNWTIFSFLLPVTKKAVLSYGCTSCDSLGGIPPIPSYESPTDIDTYIHASHRSGRASCYMLIGCINQCDVFDFVKPLVPVISKPFKNLQVSWMNQWFSGLLFGFFRIGAFKFFWERLLWTLRTKLIAGRGLVQLELKPTQHWYLYIYSSLLQCWVMELIYMLIGCLNANNLSLSQCWVLD